MTRAEAFVADIFQRYLTNAEKPCGVTQADINEHAGRDFSTRLAFYDDVGASLARQFHSGALPFGFCDMVANGMYANLLAALPENDARWPNLFYDVFLAFDRGEYRGRDDLAETDPVEVYTKPMIEQIVAAL